MNLNLPMQYLLIFYVANLIFSALVQSLIPPDAKSSPFYLFIYKFLNILITDFKSFSAQIPQPILTTIKAQTGSITTTSVADPNAVEASQVILPAKLVSVQTNITDQQAGR